MTTGCYRDRVLPHLTNYKKHSLRVVEDGIWAKSRSGQTYPHILPADQYRLNILETIRDAFFAYEESHPIKFHTDFHHLNSSQALCFNLFFPLCCTPERRPGSAASPAGSRGGWSQQPRVRGHEPAAGTHHFRLRRRSRGRWSPTGRGQVYGGRVWRDEGR